MYMYYVPIYFAIMFFLALGALIVLVRWPRIEGKGLVIGYAISESLQYAWFTVDRYLLIMLQHDTIRLTSVWMHPAYRIASRALPVIGVLGHVMLLCALLFLGRALYRRFNEKRELRSDLPSPASAPASDYQSMMKAANPVDKVLAANISLDGAALNVSSDSCDAAKIRDYLADEISARLRKKDIEVHWQGVEGANIVLRFIRIEQGNQLLRYIVPFSAPARCDVEGTLLMTHSGPRPFFFERRADLSIFGGASGYMLRVCARRSADDVAQFILINMKQNV